jgi:hypothetical protein
VRCSCQVERRVRNAADCCLVTLHFNYGQHMHNDMSAMALSGQSMGFESQLLMHVRCIWLDTTGCCSKRQHCHHANALVTCRHADARWAADVDYMFFRNSYGVAAQLATKLQACRGSAAMCCQCSWVSCSRTTKLAEAEKQLGHPMRWICRGHDACS